ncbi:MAG: hypothetical protein AAGF90_23390, partial [Pseudomonadota bacterium]
MTAHTPIRTPSGPALPDFLRTRIAKPFDDETGEHRIAAVLGADAPPRGAVMMQSNDYLSIAKDPRIVAAKIRALRVEGHGHAASRVFSHKRLDDHSAFERRM